MEKIESLIYELSEPGKLYLRKETIDPSQILPNEIIAETVYSAISPGTEVAAYTGLEPLRNDRSVYPRVVGYCNLARVIHKGEAFSQLNPGDYFLSFQSHRSHFICGSDDFFVKVDGGNPKAATVAYLFHLGYHGILTADLRAGHHVGVVGLGVLGFTSAVMAKTAGADTFVFSNRDAHKDMLAAKNIRSFPKSLNVAGDIGQNTRQPGLDIVINTSNTWADWQLSMELVNKGGTIVNLGFPGRGQSFPQFNPLDPKYLYTKNVTIKYLSALNQKGLEHYEQRFNIHRNLQYILGLMESGTIHAEEIISAEIPYTDLERQYLIYKSQEHSLFSTILNWQ